ncbi:hypothetical protein ACTXG7_03785 [Mycolicibacterium sp. Dal123E01]|uniref:hypothetical protein n=1 Tax=Mycolicibacterium sp. Dal123E01 TaxID=3457578 RepID=UPI00403E3749
MRARPVILIAVAAAAILTAPAAAAILTAPAAAADPPWPVAGAESAADTIRDLQSQGYQVGINWVFGYSRSSLDRCSVTGIHDPGGPPSNSSDPDKPTTVFIDVSCPDHDNW